MCDFCLCYNSTIIFIYLAYVKPVTEVLIAASLGMAKAVSSVSVSKNMTLAGEDIEYSQSSVVTSQHTVMFDLRKDSEINYQKEDSSSNDVEGLEEPEPKKVKTIHSAAENKTYNFYFN